MESLRAKQSRFVRLVAKLVEFATERGYDLTFGEAWRTPEQAKLNAEKGIGIANSLHTERLAIDFNLFKDGVWLNKTEAEKQRYSAIVTEAGSQDPWTSRARPSFMYVFYALLIFLVIVLPLIGLAEPTAMTAVLGNIKLGFAAIPEEMWWTFTAGYLGYTTARSYEKKSGVSNGITKG